MSPHELPDDVPPLANLAAAVPPSPYFEQPPPLADPQPAPPALADQIRDREPRNFCVLALYDVVLRIGWIFKTESVIMPAFLDAVAGAGWLRGCLPVVNRFGQSIPPAFYASRLRRMQIKKRSLAVWTLAMAVVFLTLAGVWFVEGESPPPWMAAFFLLMYAAFSMCHGINQLSYGTVQGKLIGIAKRGRLLAISSPLGSIFSLAFAWWLMGRWLELPDGGFDYIFGFTGLLFAMSAVCALAIREPADDRPIVADEHDRPFRGAWHVLRNDTNFRRFAWVVMLSGSTVIMFPHYQALGRGTLGLPPVDLMIWVMVQNAAVGLFGLLIGWIVHRRGERLALRVAIFTSSLAPLVAVVLAYIEPELGRQWFWIVFIPIGMTPISLKTMLGYTLEACETSQHPRYLSTLSLCLAAPFCFSPAVGWLVDVVGFEIVFLCGFVLIFAAGVLTWRLDEPRHRHGH